MSKASRKASSATQTRASRRWKRLGIVLLILGIAAFLGRQWLYQGLRWSERRYFAHIGDKGPLQRVQAGQWEKLQRGLWTRTMLFKRKRHWSRVRLRLTKVDLTRHTLSLWWKQKPRTIRWIMKHTAAAAAVNGGLFDPQYRPLGYFRTRQRVVNERQHRRRIDGVFFYRRGSWQIAKAKHWQRAGATIAFQSAPLLVAGGKRLPLPRKSWKVDRRSAVCLTAKGQLLMMATDGFINGLSFFELGLLMAAPAKRGGLGCRWGLNLDGGSSSQWAIRRSSDKTIHNTSGIAIPLFLLVHPRNKPNDPMSKKR